MQFDYKITSDDYVRSQYLYYKLVGYKGFRHAAPWIFAGLFFIIVALSDEALYLARLLLAGIGIWWIFASIKSLFLTPHFRRGYAASGLAQKKYRATVDEVGLAVSEDPICSWQMQWSDISLKGEGEQVFILYGANTLFMVGKQYLSEHEQKELRALSGLR